MASVYLARELGPHGFRRYVALKLIKPHLRADPEVVAMFADEARLAARLTHPNLCPVFDYGDVDGTLFIAMEYLEGRSLADVMTAAEREPGLMETAQWVSFAAYVVAEASEGLHAVHDATDERGQPLRAVHRDVSPQNIFITFDGTVRVVDLGVAWFVRRNHETQAGMMKGKFAYMAPEQLYRSDVDRRADVWSLGVCLWELLSNAQLYSDFVSRMDAEDANAPAIAPSSILRSVPSELDTVTLAALERDPETRTPTAREVSRSLRRYLHRRTHPIGPSDVADLMARLFATTGATQSLKSPSHAQGDAGGAQVHDIKAMGIYSDPDADYIEDVTTHAKGKAAPLDPTEPHPAVDPDFDVRTDAYRQDVPREMDSAKTVESRVLFDRTPSPGLDSKAPDAPAGGLRIEPTVSASPVSTPRPSREVGMTPSANVGTSGATPIPSAGSRVVDVPQAYSALSHLAVATDTAPTPAPTSGRTLAEKVILGVVGALLIASVLVLVVALLVF